jgi:hypothetical protein
MEVGSDMVVMRIEEDRKQPGGSRSTDVHGHRITHVGDA